MKLAKYKESEVTLNEKQHSEMCTILERTDNDDLEKLFKEGNENGVGDIIQDVWFTDKKRQIQEFSHNQATNGKKFCSLLSAVSITSF